MDFLLPSFLSASLFMHLLEHFRVATDAGGKFYSNAFKVLPILNELQRLSLRAGEQHALFLTRVRTAAAVNFSKVLRRSNAKSRRT